MADRSVVYRLRAETSQFKAQMAAAGASAKKAADDMTSATKEGARFRQGLDSLGGAAGKVGLVAAAGLGAAVMKAADFDQAMSNVQAATHETAQNMDRLRQAALDAGASTAFSATEAAAGIENLAKAGISTNDILGGALAGALDLAAAGQMEVADAAEAAAGAMAQFKLEGSEATHVADLLAAGAGKAQGDVSDMVMALKQGGTVAAQTGLSIEETTGTLAAMAEQSLLGSDAGTSFKTMLASLTPNSKKAAEAMEEYNIHAFDAQGNFVGMTELAGQLRRGLGDLTNEQRASALETIFGSDAVRAASIIYDNGESGIRKWIRAVDDQGFAAETARTRLDNLKGDLEELGGAFETALIGTGDGSQGALRGLVQNLTDVVNAYNKLSPSAQNATAAMLGVTALTGGGLWAFSKVVTGIADTRAALSNLGTTADGTKTRLGKFGSFMGGPWGIALGLGVTALGAFIMKQKAAAAEVDALRDSLDRQTGAITNNTREMVAKELQGEGVLTAGTDLGIDPKTVTDAALGNAAAIRKVTAATKEYLKQPILTTLEDGTQITNENARAARKLASAIGGQNEKINEARREHSELQAAMQTSTSRTHKLDGALSSLPKEVRTKLAQEGYQLSKAQVDSLQKEYNLTPKQVETLLRVLGAADARNQVGSLRSEIGALNDKTVTITTHYKTVRSVTDAIAPRGLSRAEGGPIHGPGTATSDSIPAWLSNGEHVWSAREVANAGGHAAVEAMRSQFRFAEGGAVRYPVQSSAPRVSVAAASLSDHDVRRIAAAVERGAAAGAHAGTSGVPRRIRSEMNADREFERQMSRD